jgi:hypothetical protein
VCDRLAQCHDIALPVVMSILLQKALPIVDQLCKLHNASQSATRRYQTTKASLLLSKHDSIVHQSDQLAAATAAGRRNRPPHQLPHQRLR